MAKLKSVAEYEKQIKAAITARTGAYDDFLDSQVEDMAMNKQMLSKIHNELTTGELTSIVTGSQGQQKTEINPLLSAYKDLQRTLLLQHEAVGLNYKTTPLKVKESVMKGVDNNDPMMSYLQGVSK